MSRDLRGTNQVVVDWDGTAVPAAWPEKPSTFMPGFVDAMHELHADNFTIVIDSARLNPHDAFTYNRTARSEAQAEANRQYIRSMLDSAGLTFVKVHDGIGKCPGFVYVDDRAERYSGRPSAWKHMVKKIRLRAGRTVTVDEMVEDLDGT